MKTLKDLRFGTFCMLTHNTFSLNSRFSLSATRFLIIIFSLIRKKISLSSLGFLGHWEKHWSCVLQNGSLLSLSISLFRFRLWFHDCQGGEVFSARHIKGISDEGCDQLTCNTATAQVWTHHRLGVSTREGHLCHSSFRN